MQQLGAIPVAVLKGAIMTSHPKNGPRIPARGYKKKIAKLEAENAELKMALADMERKVAFMESRYVFGHKIQLDVLKDVRTRREILENNPTFGFEAFCDRLLAEIAAIESGEYGEKV